MTLKQKQAVPAGDGRKLFFYLIYFILQVKMFIELRNLEDVFKAICTLNFNVFVRSGRVPRALEPRGRPGVVLAWEPNIS